MRRSNAGRMWWNAGRILACVCVGVVSATRPVPAKAPLGDVTFTKDVLPILQRSCQNCHRTNSIAPMPLLTYEQVRPWASAIKRQTAAREMPPWYIEKNIGIQKFKNDPSLSDEEIAKIGKWVDSGAPRGNPADAPPPLTFDDSTVWSFGKSLGKPDLVISSPSVTMEATAPDWWGQMGEVPTGLTEDRYVAAVETMEVNDVPRQRTDAGAGATSLGGIWIFHHSVYSFYVPNAPVNRESLDGRDPTLAVGFPAHEVGRNGDIFDPDAGRLLKPGAVLSFGNNHLHANGRRSKARLDVAMWFHPKGYKPKVQLRSASFGATELDHPGNVANQRLDAYYVLPHHAKIINFEPHMHAAGVRMCFEAIWGSTITTLSCAGYNHNWVRSYTYADDSAPILPKGTILHIIGTLDTTASNRRLLDYRNWTGWGNRTVADNMYSNLGYMSMLTDKQFKEEMAKRREKVRLGEGELLGCLLCNMPEPPAKANETRQRTGVK